MRDRDNRPTAFDILTVRDLIAFSVISCVHIAQLPDTRLPDAPALVAHAFAVADEFTRGSDSRWARPPRDGNGKKK
jgi:hypothetical protein